MRTEMPHMDAVLLCTAASILMTECGVVLWIQDVRSHQFEQQSTGLTGSVMRTARIDLPSHKDLPCVRIHLQRHNGLVTRGTNDHTQSTERRRKPSAQHSARNQGSRVGAWQDYS